MKLSKPWMGFLVALAVSVVIAIATKKDVVIPPIPDDPVFEGSFGWVDNKFEVNKIASNLPFPEFELTPASQVVQGDLPSEVFLWKATEKCWKDYKYNTNKTPYPLLNQGNVGMCVGTGFSHVVTTLAAIQSIESGEEFKPVSAEAIYGFSRVEIGGGTIRGDGSLGAWAARALTDYGNLPSEPIEGTLYNLTNLNLNLARTWGQVGVPNELEPIAKKQLVKTVTRIRNWNDAKKALAQRYPIALCSGVGFANRKDSNGFIRPNGEWQHCMALLGYRTDIEGGYILNSWGSNAHPGTSGLGGFPISGAGFWADSTTINRMLSSGDCWAVSNYNGFPSQKLDWFVNLGSNKFALKGK